MFHAWAKVSPLINEASTKSTAKHRKKCPDTYGRICLVEHEGSGVGQFHSSCHCLRSQCWDFVPRKHRCDHKAFPVASTLLSPLTFGDDPLPPCFPPTVWLAWRRPRCRRFSRSLRTFLLGVHSRLLRETRLSITRNPRLLYLPYSKTPICYTLHLDRSSWVSSNAFSFLRRLLSTDQQERLLSLHKPTTRSTTLFPRSVQIEYNTVSLSPFFCDRLLEFLCWKVTPIFIGVTRIALTTSCFSSSVGYLRSRVR